MEIKNKLLVMSNKGGVGKTTIAVNMAYALAKKGLKVGLMDLDIHGPNVPKMLNLEKRGVASEDGRIIPIEFNKNLKVMSIAFLMEKTNAIIWRGPIKHKLISQFLDDVAWGQLDYLIVDLPPGTGDEAISISQLLSGITGTIIVSTPQEVALLDAEKAIDFSRKLDLPIVGLIENMCGEMFGKGGVQKTAEKEDITFLGRLNLDARIRRSGDKGLPFAKDGSMDAIAERIIEYCGGGKD